MTRNFLNPAAYVWAHLGHCSLCTRKAFLCAAAGWVLALLLGTAIGTQSLLFQVVTTFAATITTLWMMHVFAFATKLASGARRGDAFNPGRRSAFSAFAGTAAIAIAGSIAPRLAFGQERCGAGTCVNGTHCCVIQYSNGTYSRPFCKSGSCYSSAREGQPFLPRAKELDISKVPADKLPGAQ